MVKKFFKALGLGLIQCKKSFLLVGKLMLGVFWLPLISILVISIFKIDMSSDLIFATLLVSALYGAILALFVYHCMKALDYSEKNNCSYSEGWNKTSF